VNGKQFAEEKAAAKAARQDRVGKSRATRVRESPGTVEVHWLPEKVGIVVGVCSDCAPDVAALYGVKL
jgi:hypothetical protein